MKVAEFFKLVEAKATELRDVINAMLQLQTHGGIILTTEDVLKRPSLAGTTIDWEFRTDKRRHVAVLYAEYLVLSAELNHMLSVDVDVDGRLQKQGPTADG